MKRFLIAFFMLMIMDMILINILDLNLSLPQKIVVGVGYMLVGIVLGTDR